MIPRGIGDLVLCTRDRADDVRRCLDSIAPQLSQLANVIVVDSSVAGATEVAVRELSLSAPWLGRLTYVLSPPGLPRQRNLGVSLTYSDVIHFLDDDVEVLPEYFATIHKIYESDKEERILGVGGVQENIFEARSSLSRRLLLKGAPQGTVLESGAARGVYLPQQDVEVEWLSGCSMSYRRHVFSNFLFDTDLSGYANGEDIDFSYRVSQTGILLVASRARLIHHHVPSNRLSSSELVRTEVENRARRISSGCGKYSQRAFWRSVIMQLALTVGQLARGRRSALPRLVGLVKGSLGARTIFAITHRRG